MLRGVAVLLLTTVGAAGLGCRTQPRDEDAELMAAAQTQIAKLRMATEAPTAPDPDSGTVWVKRHPRLRRICDAVGGCGNITVTCTKYDDTGNSNLRGETEWQIDAGGFRGYAFKGLGEGFDHAIDGWFEDRRDANADKKDEPTVYPHSQPCDTNEPCR
jgi:hypothetical protein